MSTIRDLPRPQGSCGWSVHLPPRVPGPVLAGEVEAAWAVLGAGFTGLAAARRLAEARPDDRIVVLDALKVGEGASGRNSGFAIDHAHTLGGGAAAEESAKGQKRLYTAAIEHLAQIIADHHIDCDWRAAGKVHAAVSARGAERYLRPLVAELNHIGEPHQWLDRGGVRELTGMNYYQAGIYTPGTVLLNPAALVRGLADSLPPNVTLYEETPVTAIEAGDPVRLSTPDGSLSARRLIVAGNAFLPALGFAPRRLMPFAAFASLTRPLTDDERIALGGRVSWGLTPANAFVAPTIQKTGEGRILFRDGITYRPGLSIGEDELARVREKHLKRLRARFPMLPNLQITSTWGGYLCLSRNQDSVFGALGDNIWGAGGFQGIGVTRGTITGRLVAEVALGLTNPLISDMMRIAQPPQNPPRPLLDMGVALRTAWESWRERGEA